MSPRPHPVGVQITGTGTCLPGPPIANDDLERLVGPLPPDVLEGLGVHARHWMIDPATGEHTTSTSAMAEAAARRALAAAGAEPDEVDLLLMSTASPEFHLPASVTFVQERLGLERCMTLELRSGCAGGVSALDLARRLVADGTARRAVVVGSESISPLLAPLFVGRDGTRMRIRDRLNAYSFGDGAGAVVVEAVDGPGSFLGASFACLGGASSPGMQIIGGATDVPIARQLARRRLVDFLVDPMAAGELGPRVFAAAMSELTAATGLDYDDVDVCIVPEGNAGYFSSEMAAAGLDAAAWSALQPKIVENLAEVGATGSAAVPLALDAAARSGRLFPGARVLLLAIESSRWLYAGLGLTWAGERAA